jgi:hypothetical protein
MVIDGSMPVLLTSNSQLSRKVSKNHFLTDDNNCFLRRIMFHFLDKLVTGHWPVLMSQEIEQYLKPIFRHINLAITVE